MTIASGLDTNNTFYTTGGNNMLYGLYYYYLDNNLLKADINRSIALQLPSIQTLSFLPFFNHNDIGVVQCDIDDVYFKLPTNLKGIKVYRSMVGKIKKELNSYSFQTDIDLSYNNNIASALKCFPYTYYLLSDGINPPLLIKPQMLNDNKISVVVETYITQNSKYKLYVKEQINDVNGELDSIINNSTLLLPIGTNVYNNFMVTSGNSFQATNSMALMENDNSLKQGNRNLDFQNTSNNVNAIGGLVGGILSLVSGNIGGGLGQLGKTGINYYMDNKQLNNDRLSLSENYNLKNYQIETQMLSATKDYLNTPRTMKSLGNDGLFNMTNNGGFVKLYKFTIKSSKLNMINNYYKKYGYKINEYKKPNFKNHNKWNFIKTSNCNIDSERIPHNHIKELEEIFNSGLTFWHVENDSEIGNYNQRNEFIGGY